jgi:thiol-disulfide isomerase/thioredoxin
MTGLTKAELIKGWKLKTITGTDIPDITTFAGKPLLILFFNLGCPGCKGRALPFANSIVVDYGNLVNVCGIHTNFEGLDYSDEELIKAKETYYIRFPYYRDFNFNTTFINYEAGGTPHWILTDKELNPVYSIFGSDPNNALLRLDLKIKELLQ